MKKKRKKSNLKFILLMIFVPLITFFGTIFVYDKFFNNTIPSVEDLKEEKKKDNYSDKDDSKDVSNYVNELPNLRVQYNNNDILGKLEITPLKYLFNIEIERFTKFPNTFAKSEFTRSHINSQVIVPSCANGISCNTK